MELGGILAIIAGIAVLRWVVSPWVRTRLGGPPELEAGWNIALRRLALEASFLRQGLSWAKVVSVPIKDRFVDITASSRGDSQKPGGSRTSLSLDASGLLPASLRAVGRSRFEAEDLRETREASGLPSSDVELFTDAVELTGNDALLASLFDEETRTLLKVSLFELGFRVEHGFIRYEADDLDNNYIHLVQVISRMQQLAQALAIEESDVFPRLQQIVLHERSPAIRAHVLMVMGFAFPKDRMEAIYETSRTDASPLVRLEALSGSKTVSMKDALDVLTDPLASMKTQKDAIRFALRRFRRDDVEAALYTLFAEVSGELRLVVMEALGRLKSERAAPRLAELLAKEDTATRIAAANALGFLALPESADMLLLQLQHPREELRSAVVRALGACGTIACVSAVRAAKVPQKVVDSAVARIVGRHGSPLSGALALTAGDGGELALSQAEGALSNPDEESLER